MDGHVLCSFETAKQHTIDVIASLLGNRATLWFVDASPIGEQGQVIDEDIRRVAEKAANSVGAGFYGSNDDLFASVGNSIWLALSTYFFVNPKYKNYRVLDK